MKNGPDGPSGPTSSEESEYDNDGNLKSEKKRNKGKKKEKNLAGGPGCDPDDPTGLHGYCGAPLDPNDPDYKDDPEASPFTSYYRDGHFGKNHPKDWWNHLLKDKLADAGYPRDGMMSSSILNVGSKKKMREKYGDTWDKMSPDEKDKISKEEMDKDAVEQGKKATKGRLKKKDKEIVKDLDQVEEGTHMVNYTKRENPGDNGPPTLEEKAKKA